MNYDPFKYVGHIYNSNTYIDSNNKKKGCLLEYQTKSLFVQKVWEFYYNMSLYDILCIWNETIYYTDEKT